MSLSFCPFEHCNRFMFGCISKFEFSALFINWGARTFTFDEKWLGNKHEYIAQRDMLGFNSMESVLLPEIEKNVIARSVYTYSVGLTNVSYVR